jgi:hypothetical protein
MARYRFIVVLALAACLSGCAARTKTITNLPPGVTQQQAQSWDSAVADLDKLSQAVSAVRVAVIDLNKQGVFPDGPHYVTALQIIGKIDQLEISAAAVLQQSPQNFDASAKTKVADYLTQISQQLVLLNNEGATGIKNPGSLQTINTLIAQIPAIIALIIQL